MQAATALSRAAPLPGPLPDLKLQNGHLDALRMLWVQVWPCRPSDPRDNIAQSAACQSPACCASSLFPTPYNTTCTHCRIGWLQTRALELPVGLQRPQRVGRPLEQVLCMCAAGAGRVCALLWAVEQPGGAGACHEQRLQRAVPLRGSFPDGRRCPSPALRACNIRCRRCQQRSAWCKDEAGH